MPKGEEGKEITFDVPSEYLTDRYKPIGVEVFNRFGANDKIPVKKISLPNLGDILSIGRHENFSLFLPKHQKLAEKLIDIFMGMRNVDDLTSCAVYARDRVNPYLFNYALSVAILHRPDTKDLDLPSFIQTFPDKYLDSQVFTRAREEATVVPQGSRMPIEVPKDYTASDLEEEHRLAYFREDLGINLHHWHWHLVYPNRASRGIVNKDRRGELFYYMHQQIVARYNYDRLCNKMKRVERFMEWKQPIKEAYFPKMDSMVASRSYPARVANQTLGDLNRSRDQVKADVDSLIRSRDRIFDAIHTGQALHANGTQVPLTEMEGIDILGNIVENCSISINEDYYGNMHNMGHVFISYIHDPDHRHLEDFGVMGDSATAMRDPIFYRWHAYVDDMFQEFKATLPRYTVAQLGFEGVTVTGISVSSSGGTANNLNTFWQQSDLDLSRGMDFQPRGAVFVRFTHLQHQAFSYNIVVNNSGAARMGTCRIFIAPKFDERGNPWNFREQKVMMVELDKFKVNLRAGKNTINRDSSQSSVTIPFERTFRNLELNRPQTGEALESFNFCGCGWPAHMLLPKGSPEGMVSQLFVMISNYEGDKVEQDVSGVCNDAESYCGLRNLKYPDRRSMGYPFDRMPRTGVTTLAQFLTPNMRVQDCVIKFNDRTVRPSGGRN